MCMGAGGPSAGKARRPQGKGHVSGAVGAAAAVLSRHTGCSHLRLPVAFWGDIWAGVQPWVLGTSLPGGRAGELPAFGQGGVCCSLFFYGTNWRMRLFPRGFHHCTCLLTRLPHRWATRTRAPWSSWWTSTASTTSSRSTPACRWSTRSQRRSPSEPGGRGWGRAALASVQNPPGGSWGAGSWELSSLSLGERAVRDLVAFCRYYYKSMTPLCISTKQQIKTI